METLCSKLSSQSSLEEWALLHPTQRAFYRDVMQENYETVVLLGKDSHPLSFLEAVGSLKNLSSNNFIPLFIIQVLTSFLAPLFLPYLLPTSIIFGHFWCYRPF
uniref:KRAB domain-containing protein n=1 Tax=Chrysemys picta bellii TaxID=8478 RepID=A0A8C3FBQ4_CHRPI